MFKNISWHIELSAKDIYMKCSVEVDFLSLLGQLHLPALAAKKNFIFRDVHKPPNKVLVPSLSSSKCDNF